MTLLNICTTIYGIFFRLASVELAPITSYLISLPHDHLTQLSSTTQGHNMRYIRLPARTNTHLYSLPSTIQLWNSLPEKILFTQDFDHFKTLSDIHLFNKFSVHHIQFWVFCITNKQLTNNISRYPYRTVTLPGEQYGGLISIYYSQVKAIDWILWWLTTNPNLSTSYCSWPIHFLQRVGSARL